MMATATLAAGGRCGRVRRLAEHWWRHGAATGAAAAGDGDAAGLAAAAAVVGLGGSVAWAGGGRRWALGAQAANKAVAPLKARRRGGKSVARGGVILQRGIAARA